MSGRRFRAIQLQTSEPVLVSYPYVNGPLSRADILLSSRQCSTNDFELKQDFQVLSHLLSLSAQIFYSKVRRCHAERSEASLCPASQMLRFAQHDTVGRFTRSSTLRPN